MAHLVARGRTATSERLRPGQVSVISWSSTESGSVEMHWDAGTPQEAGVPVLRELAEKPKRSIGEHQDHEQGAGVQVLPGHPQGADAVGQRHAQLDPDGQPGLDDARP